MHVLTRAHAAPRTRPSRCEKRVQLPPTARSRHLRSDGPKLDQLRWISGRSALAWSQAEALGRARIFFSTYGAKGWEGEGRVGCCCCRWPLARSESAFRSLEPLADSGMINSPMRPMGMGIIIIIFL